MDLKELKEKEFSFVFLSKDECSVCHAVFPKIKKLAEKYSKSELSLIDLEKLPYATGEFSVFSIPTLIVYSNGKELYRGARFFNLGDLEEKLDRYYSSIF